MWHKHHDHKHIYGLTREEFNDLSRYNGEVKHGIVHTKDYDMKMAKLQHIYDEHVIHAHGAYFPFAVGGYPRAYSPLAAPGESK